MSADPPGSIAGWGKVLAAAQRRPTIRLSGDVYTRLRYGYDERPNLKPRCRDCAAALGQFHVELCCAEDCPRCRAQLTSCLCIRTSRLARRRMAGRGDPPIHPEKSTSTAS